MANHHRDKGKVIVIPLHIALNFPCDYLDQTAKILSRYNSVILFDFRSPITWKQAINVKSVFDFIISVSKIFKNKHGITYFRPFSIFPFQSIPWICSINKKLGILQLKIILRLIERPKVIWRFYPLLDFGIRPLGKGFYLYDCIDYLGPEKETNKYYIEEGQIIKYMDLIAFNSKGLTDKKTVQYPAIKSKSITVVCGCAVDLFIKKRPNIPKDIKKIKGKKAILAGVLNYRLNYNLLDYILKNNPHLSVLALGPVDEKVTYSFNLLKKYPNFHHLGKKNKDRLVNYMKHSDVGIIPYDSQYLFVKYANPMKAYEYLACGLPVVSTDIVPLRSYPKDILSCVNDNASFNRSLKLFINSWNKQKAKIAVGIARKNSWENKVGQIIKHIK